MREFVSVIIPCRNAGRRLGACLRSLSHQVGNVPHEILVVDSSDDGQTRAEIGSFSEVQAILLDRPTSAGRARNIGAACARGGRLAFIDADCIASPDWLDSLARAWDAGHRAIASPLLPLPAGSLVGAASFLAEFSRWLPDREQPLLHAPTAGFGIDAELFRAAGGFREDLGTCEDTVFTHHLAAAGHVVVLLAGPPVYHSSRTGWAEVWAHHRHLGRWARRTLLLRPPGAAQFVARHPSLSYLTWPLRAGRMAADLWQSRRALRWDALAALPLACLLLFAWTNGFAHDSVAARGAEVLR